MKAKICPICGAKMRRNGKNKSGTQRWRCKVCGSSSTHRNDCSARELKQFVRWLLSKDTQIDMVGCGRNFRRKISKFWDIWPMPEIVDEIHDVIFVDGIYLERNVVILIACSRDYVLSWYLARAETSRAWQALLSRIAAPDMVVTDGGPGFAKAVRNTWPSTLVQRCLFHVFCQVKRCTTTRPKLEAGKQLYQLSKRLMYIDTLKQAHAWVDSFFEWCEIWHEFLEESHIVEGRKEYKHERLRRARRTLIKLIKDDTLFNYLNPIVVADINFPSTNNQIEGGVNAALRDMLRNHRGLSITKRIKAVFWWCYINTENPMSATEILTNMPTDKDIDLLYQEYGQSPKEVLKPQKWGQGIEWNEFHTRTRYPYALD